MRFTSKQAVAAILLGAMTLGGASLAGAAGLSEFQLEQVVVTATRTEKELKDVPANVVVITQNELQEGGYHSVFEAVKNLTQANNHTYQEDGGDYGAMISRIRMRGVDDATLVMVNGNPANSAGSATLNTIPMDQVEKIEVVKGANSVLYGPQAMGGVINIITKRPGGGKDITGNLYTQVGSRYKNAGVNVFSDVVNIGGKRNFGKDFYDAVYSGDTGGGTAINILDKRGDQLYADARLAKDLYLSYGYTHNKSFFEAGKFVDFEPVMDKGTWYESRYNTYSTTYDNKKSGWKLNAGYETIRWSGIPDASYAKKSTESRHRGHNINADVQKKFVLNGKNDTLVMGGSFNKEYLNVRSATYGGFRDNTRKSYSLYQSYDVNAGEKWEFIMGLREYWVDKTRFEDSNFELLPQIQGTYKATKDSNYYFNVGKSFQTPSISSAFYYGGNYTLNTDLKPQSGWTYEVGYKYDDSRTAFSADVFYMDVKDKFYWDKLADGTNIRRNRDKWTNKGLEVNYKQKWSDAWSTNLGVTVQDPVAESKGVKTQDTAKYILNVGADYTMGKVNLDTRLFSYLKREDAYYNKAHSSSSPKDHKLKDSLDLTMTLSFRPTTEDTLRITGRNLLGREDVLNSYEYAVWPRSVTFTYERKF